MYIWVALQPQLRVLEMALRLISESFNRVTELLGLIVDTSLKTVSSQTNTEDSYLFSLLPLKDGLTLSKQHVQEVRPSSNARLLFKVIP